MNRSFARVFLAISLCASELGNAAERSVAIEIDPHQTNKSSLAMWMGYLLARDYYRSTHNLPLPASGEIVPSFDEEVSARSDAVQIYQELKEKDKQLRDSYWETLSQIKAKGFINAYVWTFLRRSEWPPNQQPGNLAAFESWKNVNLKNHRAQTVGRLAVAKK